MLKVMGKKLFTMLYAQKFKISQYSIDNHINDTKYLNFGAVRKDYLGVYKTDFLLRVGNKKLISYFSTEPYDVGTQKNQFNVTVLLSA